MNSKPVVALAEVEGDLAQAQDHYTSWRSDGAAHILEKYDETINWIAWNPDSFPRKYGTIQRAILKHSYYVAYFVQELDRTLVIAVLDGRRAPTEIKTIMGKRTRLSVRRRHHN